MAKENTPMSVVPINEPDAESRTPAQIKREPIIVQDAVPVLDTGRFEQMQRIAGAMAATSLIPQQLHGSSAQEAQANCFLVVNQAVRWAMDPFALAQHAFVLKGKLGYEGKVIAALVNGSPKLHGSLNYAYEGEGDARMVTVYGTLAGEDEPRAISGRVGAWKTTNEQWKTLTDQMLAYRGAREWARRHMPEEMLGVYSDDELKEMTPSGPPPKRPERVDFKADTPEPIDIEPVASIPEPEPAVPELALIFTDQYGTAEEEPLNAQDFLSKLTNAMEECHVGAAFNALLQHNEDAIAELPKNATATLEECKKVTNDRIREEAKIAEQEALTG